MRMRTVLIDGLGHETCPGRCRFLLPERSRFSQIGHIMFRAVVALNTSVPFACRFVACSSRIKVEQTDRQTDRQTDTHTQTDRPSTVTLAAHARRGLMKSTKVQNPRRILHISLAFYANARASCVRGVRSETIRMQTIYN